MSRKRRRDPGSIDTQLVEIYEDLSNEKEEVRFKAAHALLQKVSADKSPTKEQLLETLTRLVRGLCSGRKAARLGFSVAFTEFIVQTVGTGVHDPKPLSLAETFECLKKQTEIGGNISGQEEKNYQLGRVFGAEAVIKSGVLFPSNSTTDDWSDILDLIFALAQKKAWLREECGWILYKSIESFKTQSSGKLYAQVLIEKLVARGLAKSPEGVAVWLGAQVAFPSLDLPTGVWQQDSPLHRKENAMLAKLLKEASAAEPLKAEANNKITQNTNWSPNLHFAWDVVMASILKLEDNKQGSGASSTTFEAFWTQAVDESLFATSASDQRKYWGFVLFGHAVKCVPAALIATILSKNFMRCVMNQLVSPDRYLHRNAQKAMKLVQARIDAESDIAITVLRCLLRAPSGRINFDQITKTKIIEKLLNQIHDRDLSDLLQIYSTIIAKPMTDDEKIAAVDRQVAVDHLLIALRSRLTGKEIWLEPRPSLFVKQVLELLATYVYFVPSQEASPNSKTADPPILEATRSVFRTRMFSCLTHLLAKCAHAADLVYELIAHIRLLDEEANDYILLVEADTAVSKALNKGWVILQKIHTKSISAQDSRKRFLSAFKLLYALTLLQVYSGEADAVSMLDDLKGCYDNLIKHKSRTEQSSSDTLLEILLGFVAKPSSLFRHLASQGFSTVTTDISEDGLQSMIKILVTKESVTGKDELFDHEDVFDEDNIASDVELDEAGSSNGNDSSSAVSGEVSDDELVQDDEAIAAEELAAFDAKLAMALGTRPATNAPNGNDEDDGSSEEDMDDDQMEALDEHLEKIFREQKKVMSKKTQNKDAREAVVNFKCRVLDLVDVYVKQEYKNILALKLLVPILDAIRITQSTVVSNKACSLVGDYFKLCKPDNLPQIPDAETALEMLRAVHQRAKLDGSNAYSSACSRASLLLVKVLAAQDRQNLRLVESVYGDTHQDFMLDVRSKVKPSFFTDWLNWSVTARK